MSNSSGKIAIIGMSGAFPGSADPDALWDNLRLGKEMIRSCEPHTSDRPGADSSKAHWVPVISCMDGIDLFDAAFFGITPHEAEITDPQHRILLEHSWRAIEHAGYDPRRYKGATGVFAGATINTYLLRNIGSHPDLMASLDPVKLNIGNGADFLTTRISYKLNLHGPSHAVQSACSTSLVAVHSACRSLLDFECDMALAGGVSINVTLLSGYQYLEGRIVSPDGHCRVFDAQAQGTVFGSGVGVVVLKRLEDAIADRDCIHAVIRGSAVNNDGGQKAGYTAPDVEGQAEVIVEALASAGLKPESISYVECHGTGTLLGDPVEVRALSKAFGENQTHSCALGSVKSNVGHLDAAAGIAGLIKVVLCLKHKMLPPSLHFKEPNPQIDFLKTPFYVNSELLPWRSENAPLRAGVSAFGVGGTNAHVVLEEAPAAVPMLQGRTWQLLILSARTKSALIQMAKNLAAYIRRCPELDLEDTACTLQTGRQRFAYRHTVVSRNHQEATELLERTAETAGAGESGAEETAPEVVFLFPGQGAQHATMGRDLYRDEPVFREHFDRCSEILRPHLGLDLNRLLCGEGAGAEQINETWLAQPALVAVEYALAQLWMSWGVRPRALLGHSLGEYTAACIAGVMTLEETLRLVALRGKLMQQAPAGAMLAISLPWKRAEELEGVEVAAINAPESSVISGRVAVIDELEKRLQRQGIACARLKTSHGFHSELMEGTVKPFVDEVRKTRLRPPEIPFISSVTGSWIRVEEAVEAEYWGRQMRATVRFSDGIRAAAMGEGRRILLETGPGQELSRLASRQCGPQLGPWVLSSMPKSAQGQECESIITTLGRLWEAGLEIDWNAFHANQKRRRVPLPTYPFERQRYWIEPAHPVKHVAVPLSEEKQDDGEIRQPTSFRNTRPVLRNTYVAPRNEVERTIVSIMERVLGIHPVGVTDKFGELGGDSLTAATVVSEINSGLQCELRIVDFYESSTAQEAALSIAVAQSTQADASEIAGGEEEESRNEFRRNQYRRHCQARPQNGDNPLS